MVYLLRRFFLLHPPVRIEDLMKEWSSDSRIDETEPGKELAKIPSLHAKYLDVLTYHSMVVKKLNVDFNKMRKLKWEYWHGDLNDPDELKKYGWEPVHEKILRQDIPIYLDGDNDLNNILLKKMAHQEIYDYCQSVLKELSQRSWQIRSYIEWQKFIAGH